MKAAIISIGSELLSGQILNRNAPSISGKLFELGIDTVFQMTVDDRHEDIVEALSLAETKCRLIFCTGGLGPTSDDLTREAVATWLQQPLKYDEPSWKHIEQIFAQLGAVAPEGNKRQCFFPKDSKILFNSAGTAHAFRAQKAEVDIIVLPGPPKEIEAIWNPYVASFLDEKYAQNQGKVFLSWRTLGKGESHIAEVVEKICAPLIHKGLVEIAYRAHMPYIETKIRFLPEFESEVQKEMDLLSAALSPWLYEVMDQNWAQSLVQRIVNSKETHEIHDFSTGGQVGMTLLPYFNNRQQLDMSANLHSYWQSPALTASLWNDLVKLSRKNNVKYLLLKLSDPPAAKDQDDGSKQVSHESWTVALLHEGKVLEKHVIQPYRKAAGKERRFAAAAALAVKCWAELYMETEGLRS